MTSMPHFQYIELNRDKKYDEIFMTMHLIFFERGEEGRRPKTIRKLEHIKCRRDVTLRDISLCVRLNVIF